MAKNPINVIVVLTSNAKRRFEIGSLNGATNTYRSPSMTVAPVIRANPSATKSKGWFEFLL